MSIPQNVVTVTAALPLSPLPCHPLLYAISVSPFAACDIV